MLIRERLETTKFSNSEKTIVDFILEQKEKIKPMTTKEIANATFTSPSTLIRIAKKMRFEGWSELKEAFLKEEEYLSSHFCDIDANLPFTAEDPCYTIASKLLTLKKEALDDTFQLINHVDLHYAIRMLDQASLISVFGVSNNGLIVQEFKHNMRRIGKLVEVVNLQGELLYNAHTMPASACALIVSYSGETPIYRKILAVLKENGIPSIALTNIGDSTVSKQADIVLRLSSREKLYSKIGTFCTDASIEYLLDVLFAGVFALHYDEYLREKIERSSQIEQGRFSTTEPLKESRFFDDFD